MQVTLRDKDFSYEHFSHHLQRFGIHPVADCNCLAGSGHHRRARTVSNKPVIPEPAEPEEMTVELARAYIAMEIEECLLIQSKLGYSPSDLEEWQALQGKRAGLELALGILNQTA